MMLLLSLSTMSVWAQNITTFASVGMGPRGIAFDSSGNLFVANRNGLSISKISPDGGIVNNSYITGLSPNSIAFDSVGNMYVSDSTQSILKYSSGGILLNATFGGRLGFNPYAIKFDTSDALFAFDSSNGRIRKISSSGVLEPTPFLTGLTAGSGGGLSFDLEGNLYVTNATANAILKVNSGGVVSTFATGFSGPIGVVVDCVGTLYVSNNNGKSVTKVTSQRLSTYATGLNGPQGLALDASGSIYVAVYGSNNITKIEPLAGI